MKKSKLILLLFTLSVYGITGFANANCDGAAVYCIQATDSTADTLVKVTFQGRQSFSALECLTGGSTFSVLNTDINNQVFYTDGQTPNILQFAQCKDNACTQSEILKTARFTLKQVGQTTLVTNFIINPSTDSFKLEPTPIINCRPFSLKILFRNLSLQRF